MKKKISITPILLAVFLIVLNRVLSFQSINAFNGYGIKYYLFIILKAVSFLGFNLIPIYFGYKHEYFEKNNFLSRISNYYIIYIIISMISVLVGTFVFNLGMLKDFWEIIFPISQNLYPFATSMIIILICLPRILVVLNNTEEKYLNSMLLILTFLLVILPTLSNKDIWSIQGGGQIIFNLYLVFFGYAIRKLLNIERNNSLQAGVGILLYVVLIIGMAKIDSLIGGGIREFNSGYSILSVLLSILIIIWIDRYKIRFKKNNVANFLIISIVITTQSINNHIFSTFLKPDLNKSGIKWLSEIALKVIIILGLIYILTIIVSYIQRTKFFKKISKLLSISSIDELIYKSKELVKAVLRNKFLWTTVSFYLTTMLQTQLITIVTGDNDNLRVFINFQPALVLSAIILLEFFTIIYMITNRFWYSYGAIFLLEIILTISTVLKIQLRHEPVLPSDMSELGSISEILNMISINIVFISIAMIIIFIALILFLQHRVSKNKSIALTWRLRLTWTIVCMFGISGLLFVNHENSVPSKIFELFRIEKKFYDQEDGSKVNGPLLQFINNVDVSVMKQPNGYSKANIQKIMNKYDNKTKKINLSRKSWAKNQTVIFVLSESFSNPQRVPNLSLSENPIPNISDIEKNNSSGLMMSNGYGGGTANMEWQSLTGLNLSMLSPTLPTPYTQLVQNIKLNPNITNLFENKIAVHPYNASLYNRQNVFKEFGFQKFYFDGSKDKLKYMSKIKSSPYVSDEAAYKNVESIVNQNNDKSQFIQLSTMQNHLPFDANDKSKNIKISGTALGNNSASVNNFVQRIRSTDIETYKFLQNIDKNKKPITVVWYGDHLPGIYAGDSMSKYGVKLHQTDYFVYNNKVAKNNINFNKLVSPNDFSALALKQANIKVSPYYGLLTEVAEKLPAITTNPVVTTKHNNSYNGSQVFVSKDGKISDYSKLNKNQRRLFNEYKLIQYDITAGKQYSAKWAMQKVK